MKGKDWRKIEQAYIDGVPFGEICRRFKVTLREVLQRARAEGWTRTKAKESPADESAANEGDAPESESNFPVVLDATAARIVDEVVAETMADIIREHKAIAGTLRRQFRSELAEYDAMCAFFATFMDHEYIEQLKANDDDGKELREYLNLALAHFKARSDAHAKLTMDGRMVVELERMAWQAEGGQVPSTYDDLLQVVHRKFELEELPTNVLEFEKADLKRGTK